MCLKSQHQWRKKEVGTLPPSIPLIFIIIDNYVVENEHYSTVLYVG